MKYHFVVKIKGLEYLSLLNYFSVFGVPKCFFHNNSASQKPKEVPCCRRRQRQRERACTTPTTRNSFELLPCRVIKNETHRNLEKTTSSVLSVILIIHMLETTGCPKKHGNSVTNSISSLLWVSIVIPHFKNTILLCLLELFNEKGEWL